ncbi:hypothetical protein IW261DRAFT_1426307 [Armillaria novae-zelandiae]|uniref:Uncharacterized protein n=1 Tax=Armillaria novae-zelandiae TaxID=153914 RepID=A0AA39U146_9AGAR|nr:hypothetical protein IW261DRAFT_1426307 [Armillaria novae-zelandiae]
MTLKEIFNGSMKARATAIDVSGNACEGAGTSEVTVNSGTRLAIQEDLDVSVGRVTNVTSTSRGIVLYVLTVVMIKLAIKSIEDFRNLDKRVKRRAFRPLYNSDAKWHEKKYSPTRSIPWLCSQTNLHPATIVVYMINAEPLLTQNPAFTQFHNVYNKDFPKLDTLKELIDIKILIKIAGQFMRKKSMATVGLGGLKFKNHPIGKHDTWLTFDALKAALSGRTLTHRHRCIASNTFVRDVRRRNGGAITASDSDFSRTNIQEQSTDSSPLVLVETTFVDIRNGNTLQLARFGNW